MPITDYNNKKPLKVSSTNDPGSSQNKAQPIILSDGNASTTGTGDVVIDFANVGGAQDIALYDENGNLLDYEIESIDTAAGTATVWAYDSWVRDDSVQAQVAYGNNSANVDRQNITGTWNNTGQNTAMVQHLEEASTPFLDSTSNDNDSSSVTGTTRVNGVFGNARDFDGNDDGVKIPDSNTLDLSVMTIVCFIKSKEAATVDNVPQRIVQKKDYRFFIGNADFGSDGNADQLAAEGFDGNGNRLFLFDGDTSTSQIGGDNTFHQIAFTYDENLAELFVDGAQQNSANSSGTLGSNPSSLTVGAGFSGKNVDGTIDAVRIYSDDKAADWFQSDFDSSPRGGQIYFSQQAAQPTAIDKNISIPVNAVDASEPTPTLTPENITLNLGATRSAADNPVLNLQPGAAKLQAQINSVATANPVLNLQPGAAKLQAQINSVATANPEFDVNSFTTVTVPETQTIQSNPRPGITQSQKVDILETTVSSSNPGPAVQPGESSLSVTSSNLNVDVRPTALNRQIVVGVVTELESSNPSPVLEPGDVSAQLQVTGTGVTIPNAALEPGASSLRLDVGRAKVQNLGFGVQGGNTSFQLSSSQVNATTENPSITLDLSLVSPTKGVILNKNKFAVMESHTFKENDLGDSLNAELKDRNGAIDLRGTQQVRLIASDREGNNVLTENVNVVNASEGEVEYKWEAGDFVQSAGVYRIEFEIQDSTGEVETVPNDGYITVEIEEELN